MRRIGLLPNLEKPEAITLAARLVDWLLQRQIEPVVTDLEAAHAIGRPALHQVDPWSGLDFAIVLGGDGTLLEAAKQAVNEGTPLLGVNMGHLGFLTEIEEREVFEALESHFLRGDYVLDARIMLEAQIRHDGQLSAPMLAVNDAVVTKGPLARLVHLRAYVGSTFAAAYPADGLIVATPTGSTAYSLSAGGPVAGPGLEILLLTPVCPHSFYSRSLVVGPDTTIRIEVADARGGTMLTLDGQHGVGLETGDEVLIRRAPRTARFMRRPNWDFYSVLRRKLAERQGISEPSP